MKYDIVSLDKALDLLLPSIKKAKRLGITFNRPTILDMVAKDFFISSLNREWDPSFDERIAYFICQEACYDLSEKGYISYGDMEWDYGI